MINGCIAEPYWSKVGLQYTIGPIMTAQEPRKSADAIDHLIKKLALAS